MVSFGEWRCSWSLVAIIASFVVLVSLVHLFMYPLRPSLSDYFGIRSPPPSSCSPLNNGSAHVANGSINVANGQLLGKRELDVNLTARFPADSRGTVRYRGAPWKAEIGRWLSGCGSDSMPIDVAENIGSEECENNCSFQGVCNRDLGQCRCFHGFAGEGCIEELQLDCNLSSTPDMPFGPWVVSICPGHCDTKRAMCFCGKEAAYPNRPLAESCGFEILLPSEPGGHKTTNWLKADKNVYSTNISKPGWCNINPKVAYASHLKVKEECDCKYDGLSGRFCEIPTMSSCINQCSGHGHCRGGFCQWLEVSGLRSFFTLNIYRDVYDHIVKQYPYWNRSSGRDHIWFFSWDEGACYAPKEIWNSVMLVHWGNTNTKHKRSTTAYWADDWDKIPSERRGNHPCFDPAKDLVLPAWKRPDPGAIWLRLWARPREERKTLFYFNGNLGPAYEHGRPEEMYSMGIRQKVAEEFGSTPNKKGMLGKQRAEDVIVTSVRSPTYLNDLASSKFCGVFPGDGWSGRMEDSILQGCIPVIIQDGIFLPYENVLNYESFAIRISEDGIPEMINILRSINETQIDSMLESVRSIWQRFLYRDSIMLEAARQEHLYGKLEDWGVEFSNLKEDDVFSTFIQVLHYKLHNDPWRRDLHDREKDFGLSETCLKGTNHD